MKNLGLIGAVVAITGASQAHALTVADFLPAERRQHLVTIEFVDPASTAFSYHLVLTSRTNFHYSNGVEYGSSEVQDLVANISLSGGALSTALFDWSPNYSDAPAPTWLISNVKYSGNSLSFWARVPFAYQKGIHNACDGPLACHESNTWGIFEPESYVSLSPGAKVGFSHESAVPEPAAWAMMIAGFGLVGAVMRLRRTAITV